MDSQTLFIVSVVGAFTLIVYFVIRLVGGDDGVKALRSRLGDGGQTLKHEKSSGVSDVSLLQRIGSAAARPFMPETREKHPAFARHLDMPVSTSHRRSASWSASKSS